METKTIINFIACEYSQIMNTDNFTKNKKYDILII